jgi:uncharacterized protein YkwD
MGIPPDLLALAQTPPPFAGPVEGGHLEPLERDLWWAVNRERMKNRLPTLGMDGALLRASKDRSKDMIDRNYFSHTTPEGKTFGDLLREKGIVQPNVYVGEAIARTATGGASDILKAWLESPTHRQVLMSPYAKRVGLGMVENPVDGKKYLVFVTAGQ